MRVLLITEDEFARATLTDLTLRSGNEVCASVNAAEVMEATRSAQPQAVVIQHQSEDGCREILLRARSAAEERIPALFVSSGRLPWLYAGVPPALLPASVVASDRLQAEFGPALSGLTPREGDDDGPFIVGPIRFSPERRQIEGPSGTTRLTPSESTLLATLAAHHNTYLSAKLLGSLLWDEPRDDRYARAAIRSHIYTLRRKLTSIGLEGVLTSIHLLGYRLDLETHVVEGQDRGQV